MVGNLNIFFFLYRSRANRKETMPVFCRITLDGKRKQFSTGCFLREDDWNARKFMHTGNTAEAKHVNARFSAIRKHLLRSYDGLIRWHTAFTVDELFDHYSGKTVVASTILGLFDHHMAQIRELVGKDYSEATLVKFGLIKSHVAEFIKHHYRKPDLALSELRLGFLQDLDHYLKTQKKHNQNTVNKTIERVKKITKIAVAHGWLALDPFALFRKKRFVKEVVYLDGDELKILEEHELTERLSAVWDVFVFSCYTGLAYQEVSTLRLKHLKDDKKGGRWIEMVRQKTKRPVCVLLLPKALEILRSYGYPDNDGLLLPKISNQKLNAYLKELASKVGITKNLTHHIARKTFASTVLINNDVPVDVASFMLGHSRISTTEEFYAKVQRERVVSYMSKFSK
ncbi:site-specific integrase [Mucilaginibacter daejeonensis]|uniref:site-specific integrase n=1 Tax=Mucilaginibacter daejeonensis TaxID=398049 RepID=UPI001D175906|nr:site-specific integrase [Mucilaginibacter daejeonensis]UEG53369.1 site-specific integrase [Mucilaginibacter daejeonensis]